MAQQEAVKDSVHPERRVGKIILDYLALQPGDSILEIGCSIGTQARQIATLGYRVTGIDPEFSLATKFNALAHQNCIPNAVAFVGDGHTLPFPEQSFNSVIATEVLEHTREPARVLCEIFRILRGGGTLCLAVPTENTERLFGRLHPRWTEFSGHLQIFSPNQLFDLMRQTGFTIITIHGESSEWTLFWLLFAALRTPFDFTGTPTANLLLVRLFWKIWRTLNAWHLWTPIQIIGDKYFPKSVYVYAQKR